MTAFVELVIRAPSREEATDALRAQLRTFNHAHRWDASDETCLRLLAWLRDTRGRTPTYMPKDGTVPEWATPSRVRQMTIRCLPSTSADGSP